MDVNWEPLLDLMYKNLNYTISWKPMGESSVEVKVLSKSGNTLKLNKDKDCIYQYCPVFHHKEYTELSLSGYNHYNHSTFQEKFDHTKKKSITLTGLLPNTPYSVSIKCKHPDSPYESDVVQMFTRSAEKSKQVLSSLNHTHQYSFSSCKICNTRKNMKYFCLVIR